MRYLIFRIPYNRTFSGGGWDDLFYQTDDASDARQLIERDGHFTIHRAFPSVVLTPIQYAYQIIDLKFGEIIFDTRFDVLRVE